MTSCSQMLPSNSSMRPTSRPLSLRLLADIEKPLEVLKTRLTLAIILLSLIDIESFGFSLEGDLPFEHQKVYTDINRQSFLWVHQKLVGMLEPYEVLSNTDLRAWYEDNLRKDLQVSPPQSDRRQPPTIVSQITKIPPHRASRDNYPEPIRIHQSPQSSPIRQLETVTTFSPIVIRSSNTAGTHPLTVSGQVIQTRPF